MTPPIDTILQVEGLRFGYDGERLFDGWSGAFPAGVSLVQGGDGRGKSSLMRLLAGTLQAEAGVIALGDVRLDRDAAAYRKQVYFVETRAEQFDQMTALEFFASLHAQFPAFDDSLLPALCEGLSLTPHLEKKLFMLSTGSKRKVWLAAAFAAGATVNLLDDPFAGLDQGSIRFFLERLSQAAKTPGQAWIITLYEAPPALALDAHFDLGD